MGMIKPYVFTDAVNQNVICHCSEGHTSCQLFKQELSEEQQSSPSRACHKESNEKKSNVDLYFKVKVTKVKFFVLIERSCHT